MTPPGVQQNGCRGQSSRWASLNDHSSPKWLHGIGLFTYTWKVKCKETWLGKYSHPTDNSGSWFSWPFFNLRQASIFRKYTSFQGYMKRERNNCFIWKPLEKSAILSTNLQIGKHTNPEKWEKNTFSLRKAVFTQSCQKKKKLPGTPNNHFSTVKIWFTIQLKQPF